MCGCGGGRGINIMQVRRQNLARRNRLANQQANQQVIEPLVQLQQPINYPRRFLGRNRKYPFLIRRRFI
jgi:hypothetical protein